MKRTTIKQVNEALTCLNLHLGVKPGEKVMTKYQLLVYDALND